MKLKSLVLALQLSDHKLLHDLRKLFIKGFLLNHILNAFLCLFSYFLFFTQESLEHTFELFGVVLNAEIVFRVCLENLGENCYTIFLYRLIVRMVEYHHYYLPQLAYEFEEHSQV